MKDYKVTVLLAAVLFVSSSVVSGLSTTPKHETDIRILYKPLIDIYSHGAYRFLSCMSNPFAQTCYSPVLDCLKQKDPIGCIEKIHCAGKSTLGCIHLLKNYPTVSTSTGTTPKHETDIRILYKPLIDIYSHGAYRFLSCMSNPFAQTCYSPVLDCLKQKDPIGCIEKIHCAGKSTLGCIHLLKNYPTVTTTTGTTST